MPDTLTFEEAQAAPPPAHSFSFEDAQGPAPASPDAQTFSFDEAQSGWKQFADALKEGWQMGMEDIAALPPVRAFHTLTEKLKTTPEELQADAAQQRQTAALGQRLGILPAERNASLLPTAPPQSSLTPVPMSGPEPNPPVPEEMIQGTALANELAGTVQELGSPENLLILSGTAGAGAIPKVGQYLQRAVSGYFGVQGARGVVQAANELRAAVNPEDKGRAWGRILVNAGMVPALAHTFGPLERTAPRPPGESFSFEQARPESPRPPVAAPSEFGGDVAERPPVESVPQPSTLTPQPTYAPAQISEPVRVPPQPEGGTGGGQTGPASPGDRVLHPGPRPPETAPEEIISKEAAAEPSPPARLAPAGAEHPTAPAALSAAPRAAEADRPWDLIDDVESSVGGKLSLASALEHDETFKARDHGLQDLISKTGGTALDDALSSLHQQGLARRIETEGELLDALKAAAAQRKTWKTRRAAEDAALEAEAKTATAQSQAWQRESTLPGENKQAITPESLLAGDSFTLRGEPVRVRDFEFDDNGDVAAVNLEGGRKFGRPRVEAGETLHVDAGSVRRSAADPVADWLDRAIAATDHDASTPFEGVTGAPVWLTKAAANGALRVVRLAYKSGKAAAQAIAEGVAWLREQNLPGFHEGEAREFLGRADLSPRVPVGVADLPPVLHSGREVGGLVAAKRALRARDYPTEESQQLVNNSYRPADFAGLKGRENAYLVMPSTHGANPLPLLLARRLARDFGGEIVQAGAALAKREAKLKSRFLSRLADPSAFSFPPDLAARLRGRHVVLVDDIFTSGETAQSALADLQHAGVKVDALAVLRAKDGARRANLPDYTNLATKLAAALKQPVDQVRGVIKLAYPRVYAKFLSAAWQEATDHPREVYDAIARQAEAVRAHLETVAGEGQPGAAGVPGPGVPAGIPGLAEPPRPGQAGGAGGEQLKLLEHATPQTDLPGRQQHNPAAERRAALERGLVLPPDTAAANAVALRALQQARAAAARADELRRQISASPEARAAAANWRNPSPARREIHRLEWLVEDNLREFVKAQSATGVRYDAVDRAAGERLSRAYGHDALETAQAALKELHARRLAESLDAISARLDRLKLPTGPENLHAFGLAAEMWNRAIEQVQADLARGADHAEAIDNVVKWLRAQQVKFDERGVRAALTAQFTQPGPQEQPPEGYGPRAFPAKLATLDEHSAAVMAGLTEKLYKLESHEERNAVAGQIIQQLGPDEALKLYQAADPRVMPDSFREALGARLDEAAAYHEQAARVQGNRTESEHWIKFQQTLLNESSRQATALGQGLEARKHWYEFSPAAKVAEARAAFESARANVWRQVKPDVDAWVQRINAARLAAADLLRGDPETNQSARAAVDEAVLASPETRRAVIMELAEEWSQSKFIVNDLRARLQGKVESLLALQSMRQGPDVRARTKALLNDVLDRVMSIAYGHFQMLGETGAGHGADTFRTLAEKIRERTGLSKRYSEEIAGRIDALYKAMLESKTKALTARLARQRANQARAEARATAVDVANERSLDRSLRQQLRERNQTLGAALRQSIGERHELGRTLAQRIVERAGLTGEAATRLALALQRRYEALLKVQAARELARLSPRQRQSIERKGMSQKLLEAANMGQLDNETAYNLVRERLGLPVFTDAIQREVQRRANDIQTIPKDQLARRHRAETDLMEYVARQKGLQLWRDIVPGMFFNNALAGPLTHARNFVFTGVLGAADNFVSLMHAAARGDFGAAETMLRGAGRGLGRGLRAGAEEVMTGQIHKTGEKVGETRAFDAARFSGRLAWLNVPLWLLRAPTRLLRAEDLVWFRPNEEIAQSLALRDIARREGLRGPALRARLEELRGTTAARVAAAEAQAVSEGYRPNGTVKERLAYRTRLDEIMTAHREAAAPGLVENSLQSALRATLNNKPYGALGWVLEKYNSGLNELYAGSRPRQAAAAAADIAVPFRRIAVNMLNESLNWTPIGTARAWAGQRTGRLYGHELTDPAAVGHLHTKAILGSMLITGLAAAVHAGLVQVFGLGPPDKNKRKLWAQAGHVPYSVQIGNTSVNYQSTPLGYPLAVMGSYYDAQRYRGLDAKDADVRLAFALQAGTRAWLDQNFLNNTRELLDALSAADASQATPEHFIKALSRPIATGAVPGKAFLDFVDRVFDPTVYDAHGVNALLVAQVPFVRANGRPELDALGQPIRRLVTDRDFRTFEPDALYKVLDEKNAWPSTPDPQTIIGDKRLPGGWRQISPDEYYDYVRTSGREIYRRLQADRTYLNLLPPAEAQRHVQQVTDEERKFARERFVR